MRTTRIIKRGMTPKYDVGPQSDAPFISEAEIAAMLDKLRKDPGAAIQRFTARLTEPDGTIAEISRRDIEHLRETLAIEDPDERAYHFEMQDTAPRDITIECFATEFKSRQAYVWAWREAKEADRALAEAQMRWARAKARFEAICTDNL